MVTNVALNGLKIVVTRPEQQAQALCEAITINGGEAIVFPVIDIATLPVKDWMPGRLDQYDMLIFVSRNAVSLFVEALSESISEQIQLVAVGDGTADTIRSYGLKVAIQPDSIAGSEGLLAMPALDDVAGKTIGIVKGKGGRELLADSLIARGANIGYIEVYERVISSPSASQRQQALTSDCIVCTSVAGVENLCQILGEDIKFLFDKPLVVVSERIKTVADKLGFQRIMVTHDVSDTEIMRQLTEMEY
ncbi:MAG: uroporphyrinogen-III synthase [Gammaproteobacteria bacterium]|nr:uroporphyrinogen-III synthase [Gammaproteobacteria bacterium]